jgi:Ser/Thr protein kinase RdoA (MazF antagonist)
VAVPTRPVLAASAVCAAFALGRPLTRGRRVHGGYLHHVWRLDTERGAYAVKVLNPHYRDAVRRPGYLATIELECAALGAGVPAPSPVESTGGGWLAELPAGLVRVHHWVDGRPLRDRDVGPEHARQAAAALARVHALGLRRDVRAEDALETWSADEWREPTLALPELASLLPAVERAAEAVAAGRALVRDPVLSHGDVSAKNLIERPDGTVALLDWDAAQPVEPCLETAAAALSMAGYTRGAPRPHVLDAFLDGYRGAGGRFAGGDRRLLAGLVDGLLGWVWLNYRRAAGGLDLAERRDGRRTAIRAVREVLLTLDSRDEWADLLSRPAGGRATA